MRLNQGLHTYKMTTVESTGSFTEALDHLLRGGAVTWASKRINVILVDGGAYGFRAPDWHAVGNLYDGASAAVYEDETLMQEFLYTDDGGQSQHSNDYYLLTVYEQSDIARWEEVARQTEPVYFVESDMSTLQDLYAPTLTRRATSIPEVTFRAPNPFTYAAGVDHAIY